MKQFFLLLFLGLGVAALGEAPVIPVAVSEPTEAAIRFYKSGNILWGVKVLWGLALPALILFTGLSVKMRQLARCLGRRAIWAFTIFVIFYSILITIVSFPLDYYSGFVRPNDYGLSTQLFGRWLNHYLISFLVKTTSILIVFGVLSNSLRKPTSSGVG